LLIYVNKSIKSNYKQKLKLFSLKTELSKYLRFSEQFHLEYIKALIFKEFKLEISLFYN